VKCGQRAVENRPNTCRGMKDSYKFAHLLLVIGRKGSGCKGAGILQSSECCGTYVTRRIQLRRTLVVHHCGVHRPRALGRPTTSPILLVWLECSLDRTSLIERERCWLAAQSRMHRSVWKSYCSPGCHRRLVAPMGQISHSGLFQHTRLC